MRVLIVDDSQIMRKIIRANLNKMGIDDVVEAFNGLLAYQSLVSIQNIDLIFTDINMPHMNGIDFIKKIRLNSKLKNLDIVVISDQAALVNKAVEELNISGYVLKPFDIKNFNTTITPIIERIKNDAEQKNKTKIEPQEVKALLENEVPQIALTANNVALEFNNCSLTIDINSLSDIAVFKAKE